jgi:hypothetical protein
MIFAAEVNRIHLQADVCYAFVHRALEPWCDFDEARLAPVMDQVKCCQRQTLKFQINRRKWVNDTQGRDTPAGQRELTRDDGCDSYRSLGTSKRR